MDGDEVPAWIKPGAMVLHDAFGSGVVHLVGDYKGTETIWVDFDYGARKALLPKYAVPHLFPLERRKRTRPDRKAKCDVCGSRPVVMTAGSQQYCAVHLTSYDPSRR